MRLPRSTALLAAVAWLTACDDGTGPGTSTSNESISLSQFESAIAQRARIEIQFSSLTGLVAREVEIEPDDDEEKIVSRVSAIDSAAGTLTLELGGMVIGYDQSTRFRTLSNSNAARSAWEIQLIAALSAGQSPSIEARRSPPETPQHPTSGTFFADDLRITSPIDEARIEGYVDADNFVLASSPTLAVLTVFGLPVEILNSTQLRRAGNGTP